MRRSPKLCQSLAVVAALALAVAVARASAQSPIPAADVSQKIDTVFERWTQPGSPGCALGLSGPGVGSVAKAYGLANLEFNAPITPDSIFESGSVAKQFTAAAIGLLVLEGKLAVTDPARKYVPELPAFASGVTIQHLLTHTGGLREQWPLLSMAGRPPTEAVHTIDEILDLTSRQRRANFAPGEHYLYNNTAFTLLGVVVSRVSGQSLQAFSDVRLFKPLGMSSTRWREDHRQVVRGRTTAYRQTREGRFETLMSITNVTGNGGLLTTVGDLLKWNANLDDPRVGGRALVEWLETRGRLNDGFENEYARGLTVTSYRGLREVSHGGSTAGYQTFLARFPEARVSVAVLCNTTGTNPDAMAHAVADVALAGRTRDDTPRATTTLAEDVLRARTGLYRDPASGALLEIVLGKDGPHLQRDNGPRLLPLDGTRFATPGRAEYAFEPAAGGTARLVETPGHTHPTTWVKVDRAAPSADALAEYVGRYTSAELEVSYRLSLRNGKLVMRHHGDTPRALDPADKDAFVSTDGVVRFTRDAANRIDGFTVYLGRVWHLRFDRETGAMESVPR